MAVEILTRSDLDSFKETIIQEMKDLFAKGQSNNEEYMRTKKVLEVFDLSSSSLQNYINEKIITTYKLKGNNFYKKSEIEALIESGRVEL